MQDDSTGAAAGAEAADETKGEAAAAAAAGKPEPFASTASASARLPGAMYKWLRNYKMDIRGASDSFIVSLEEPTPSSSSSSSSSSSRCAHALSPPLPMCPRRLTSHDPSLLSSLL